MVKNRSFVKKISLFLPVQSMAIFSSIKSYMLENNSCDYFQTHHFLTFKHFKLILRKKYFFFRRIVDGGIRSPSAICCNQSTRELFIYDSSNYKITFFIRLRKIFDSGFFQMFLLIYFSQNLVHSRCSDVNRKLLSIFLFLIGSDWSM